MGTLLQMSPVGFLHVFVSGMLAAKLWAVGQQRPEPGAAETRLGALERLVRDWGRGARPAAT